MKHVVPWIAIPLIIVVLWAGISITSTKGAAAKPGAIPGLSEEWMEKSDRMPYPPLNREMQIELMARCLVDAGLAYKRARLKANYKEFSRIQAELAIAFFEYRTR